MKKVLALVLSLMLVVLCVSAFAEVADEQAAENIETETAPTTINPEWILGDWYGETDGAVINIRLNEDGTAQCFIGDAEVTVDLVWTLNGNIVTVVTKDGTDPLSGPYMEEDDVLPLSSEDGMQVLFTREKIESSATTAIVESDAEAEEKSEDVGESELAGAAASALQSALTGVTEAATSAGGDVENINEGITEALVEGATKGLEAVADVVEGMPSEEDKAEQAEMEVEDIPAEDENEAFFHDPEGWMLDGEMNLTTELLDIFDHAMAAETRFNIQPILHLGTKIETDFVEHCYLAVISSLEDPDNEVLYLIYIDVPEEGEPTFYAGLELMLTLSPYEEEMNANAE